MISKISELCKCSLGCLCLEAPEVDSSIVFSSQSLAVCSVSMLTATPVQNRNHEIGMKPAVRRGGLIYLRHYVSWGRLRAASPVHVY